MVKVYFNTRPFVTSHMRQPRGRGSWAFAFEGQTVFSPSMTYADAKKWARDQVRAAAPADADATYEVDVDVLP